jgi:hypothetical protein
MTQQTSPDPAPAAAELEPEAEPEPEPFARGTFALFARDDGAVVLAVRTGPDDEWTETIPAEMVTLARQFKEQLGGDTGPLRAFRALKMARKARRALQ